MKKYIAIVLLVFSGSVTSALAEASWFAKEGSELYLLRSGYETHRAVFDYPADCELIAKTMNEAEPLAKWYCK